MRLRSVLLWGALLLFLGGGAVLTSLRVLQPEAGLFVRIVAMAPFALFAYLMALVLLGTQLRVLGPRLIPLVVLALLGLGLHGWWLAPYRVGSEPEPSPGGQRLRVMTVNMLNGAGSAEDVVQAAADHRIDLLAVQEITPPTLWMMESAGINEQLPFHAGQAEYGVTGTMLLSRFPLGQEHEIATQWTSFSVVAEVDGAPVKVVVTHPESPMGDAAGWRADHDVLRSAAQKRRPDLLVGDLNATADHQVFDDLLRTGLRDATEVANSGRQPTWPSSGQVSLGPFSLPPVIAIDHIMLGEGWTATHSEVVPIDDTDHAALVAEVAQR